MEHALKASTTTPQHSAAVVVEEFLRLMMIPAPEEARQFTASHFSIRFTGGRPMERTQECAAFNANRYAWVKKTYARTDVAMGATDDEAVVYISGSLYGAWPDGTPFEGNRYIDRYTVQNGLITQMEVWNDSAEWMLVRAGLADPWPSPMGDAAAKASANAESKAATAKTP